MARGGQDRPGAPAPQKQDPGVDPNKKARDEERGKPQERPRWPFAERKTPEPPQ